MKTDAARRLGWSTGRRKRLRKFLRAAGRRAAGRAAASMMNRRNPSRFAIGRDFLF